MGEGVVILLRRWAKAVFLIERMMNRKLQIHNSTAEFLIFQIESKEQGIEVLYQDETLWLTQDAIAVLFDKSRSTIAEHLRNVFLSQELQEASVCRKFRRTAADGKEYATKYYNLDAVISVGYRVNSVRATQFRQWCTYILRQFAIRGYVIDKKRMENGSFIGEDYFEHLLAEFAKQFAESEFEKYRVIQDKNFSSDFDRFISDSPLPLDFAPEGE